MQFSDNISALDVNWQTILKNGLAHMDSEYLQSLHTNYDFLPNADSLFSAFTQPLANVRYVLLGESPYPRPLSANGYAFWDNAINSIWSETGFSKELNRATSLRNFVKMLLFARGDLSTDFSQAAIAKLDKSTYIQTISQLFNSLLQEGFLLLNSSLIYSAGKVPLHARNWRPFIDYILQQLIAFNPATHLILLGKISEKFTELNFANTMIAEHPYNISFITNPFVNKFFKPFDLLGDIRHA